MKVGGGGGRGRGVSGDGGGGAADREHRPWAVGCHDVGPQCGGARWQAVLRRVLREWGQEVSRWQRAADSNRAIGVHRGATPAPPRPTPPSHRALPVALPPAIARSLASGARRSSFAAAPAGHAADIWGQRRGGGISLCRIVTTPWCTQNPPRDVFAAQTTHQPPNPTTKPTPASTSPISPLAQPSPGDPIRWYHIEIAPI